MQGFCTYCVFTFTPPHYIGCLFNQGRGGNRNQFCCSGLLLRCLLCGGWVAYCLLHACMYLRQPAAAVPEIAPKPNGSSVSWKMRQVFMQTGKLPSRVDRADPMTLWQQDTVCAFVSLFAHVINGAVVSAHVLLVNVTHNTCFACSHYILLVTRIYVCTCFACSQELGIADYVQEKLQAGLSMNKICSLVEPNHAEFGRLIANDLGETNSQRWRFLLVRLYLHPHDARALHL